MKDSSEVKYPIFINNSGDLLFYSDLESAQQGLEIIDIENNEYEEAYDSEGYKLKIGVLKKEMKLDDERIYIYRTKRQDKKTLKTRLLEFIMYIYKKKGVDTTGIRGKNLNSLISIIENLIS